MIGEISAIGSALLWSASNIMVRSASDRMSVLSLNALRSAAGAVFVLATLFAVGKAGEVAGTPPLVVIYLIGAVLLAIGIGDTLYFRSMALVGVSRATPVSNIYPLFTLPIAFLFLGEGLTWLNVLGTILIVVGVYQVARSSSPRDGIEGTRRERFRYEGVLLALGAAVCWAFSTSILKVALLETDVFVANSIRVPVAALVLLALAARSRTPIRVSACGWRALTLAALAGVVSIGLGGLLYLVAVQEAGAAKAAALTSINPIFAAPLSVAFLKEKLTLPLIGGTAISIVGIWLIL